MLLFVSVLFYTVYTKIISASVMHTVLHFSSVSYDFGAKHPLTYACV